MIMATNVKEVKSTCPYCGVGCGVILRAENGRLVGCAAKVAPV